MKRNLIEILIIAAVGGLTIFFAGKSIYWRDKYEIIRDQFSAHVTGGFTNDPTCLKVMWDAKVPPFTVFYTNTVMITNVVTKTPEIDWAVMEWTYKRGVTNGVICYGNTLAEALSWRQGTGSIAKTVADLMEFNKAVAAEASATWKRSP